MGENQMASNASRRHFLKASTATMAAGALALGAAKNVHAAGSDTIRIGLIGAGSRGTGAVAHALNTNSGSNPVKLIAIGDVFEDKTKASFKELEESHSQLMDVPEDQLFWGFDAYQKVLATDCDLVVLATPPGFRPIHFEAAVNAGKHIFMEKPVATDAAGVRQVLAANKVAKEKNLAVAVGLQRRHEQRYREMIQRLQDGLIGEIHSTRVYWNGNTPWVKPRRRLEKDFGHTISEMEYQLRNWYHFVWLCGDHIVEQHIHNLDVSNWLLGDYPAVANGLGGRQDRHGHDRGEIFDHHFVEFTYPNGAKMYSQCRHIPGCWRSVSEHAHGAKGTADIAGAVAYDPAGDEVWSFGRGGAEGHQQEHIHLFADLRAGKMPNEGDYGALSTMTSIMGRMATYCGQELTWEECLHSEVRVGVEDFASFDDVPPTTPQADGTYAIPMPGLTRVI